MSTKDYKLSRTLYGHSLDVRSVATTSKDDIISGSRDKTAKFWKHNAYNRLKSQARFKVYTMIYPGFINWTISANGPTLSVEMKFVHLHLPIPSKLYKLYHWISIVDFLPITTTSPFADIVQFINPRFQNNFEEVMTYTNHKNFVGSVVYLEPTEEYPDGLVVTGGNDNLILIFKPSEPFPTLTIKEHTNAVSCLNKVSESNAFLSGSWDSTAKYFRISGTPKCTVTFKGHQAAIWSVIQITDSRVATASADKTIGIWDSNGQKMLSLTGHTDCVRSLADFPDLGHFVSVANDAAIKVWSYSGENIATYYGHANYIYSVARCKANGPDAFVTSGEDCTVRYWQNGENTQTIQLPAQSVWTVTCLSNGDIVSGSSDAVVRVFSRDDSRIADEQALTKFNEEVNALKQQSVQEIGGVKVSDLPGREALYDPGKRAGQMKMIRDGGGVVAYTWVQDGENSHWEKVGDVMGGTDKDSSGKTMYEGKAYDFVFSVDVEDGKPPLKLPYNRGDDVYQAAHAFLSKHLLPADYLEQVVDFILKNSKEQYVPPASDYQDPFTGGNRYTPSYSNTTQSVGANFDPFTGASSYSTGSSKATTQTSANGGGANSDPFTGSSSYTTIAQSSSAYFPVTTYRTFDTGDPNVILNKLKEFNEKATGSNNNVPNDQLENLVKLCVGPSQDPSSFDVLFKLLDWPEEIVFPVLDIVRMAVRHSKNNETIATANKGVILEKLKSYINSTVPNNTIVALRTFCNFCSHSMGESLVHEGRFDILEGVTSLAQLNKNGQIALSTLLLNMTILCIRKQDDLGISVLAQVLPDILTKLTDPESHFRAYVAIGTLVISSNSQKQEVVAKINESSSFLSTLQLHSFGGGNDLEKKRSNCVKQLQSIL